MADATAEQRRHIIDALSAALPGRDKADEQPMRRVEAVAAGFYNIDIDSSTLVDLSQPTLDEQGSHDEHAGDA